MRQGGSAQLSPAVLLAAASRPHLQVSSSREPRARLKIRPGIMLQAMLKLYLTLTTQRRQALNYLLKIPYSS